MQPEQSATHEAFTRLPHRLEPDAATPWREAAGHVERRSGVLVIDDSTLGQPVCPENRVGSAALVGQAGQSR